MTDDFVEALIEALSQPISEDFVPTFYSCTFQSDTLKRALNDLSVSEAAYLGDA